MPVVTNTGGDLHFPGVSLTSGANIVAPGQWERLKQDRAVAHYLRVGRLTVGGGAEPPPPPQPQTVQVSVSRQPTLPEMPRPRVVDYSGVRARKLCERVGSMSEQELDQLLASGEQRKTVMRAVEARYAGLAVGD